MTPTLTTALNLFDTNDFFQDLLSATDMQTDIDMDGNKATIWFFSCKLKVEIVDGQIVTIKTTPETQNNTIYCRAHHDNMIGQYQALCSVRKEQCKLVGMAYDQKIHKMGTAIVDLLNKVVTTINNNN